MKSHRPSPATAHRQRVLAAMGNRVLVGDGGTRVDMSATGPAGPAANDPVSREAAQMALMLIDHRQSLKQIQSREAKIALKRELLPLYTPWIEGVLAGNTGQGDTVFATILVWTLDVGDFVQALPMIRYVLAHRMSLPEQITRTPATFITEEIAEAALQAFAQGGEVAAAFPIEVLAAIEDLVDDEDPDLREDMPDEVRAKLHKALAKAILRDGEDDRTRQQESLKHFLRALELDAGAGVKKDIEQLQRKLKKADEEPASATEQPPASTASEEAS